MKKDGVFSPEDTSDEVQRLDRPSKIVSWKPREDYSFEITIPPTVYPPREDTDLLARRLILLGPGRGRRFLDRLRFRRSEHVSIIPWVES